MKAPFMLAVHQISEQFCWNGVTGMMEAFSGRSGMITGEERTDSKDVGLEPNTLPESLRISFESLLHLWPTAERSRVFHDTSLTQNFFTFIETGPLPANMFEEAPGRGGVSRACVPHEMVICG